MIVHSPVFIRTGPVALILALTTPGVAEEDAESSGWALESGGECLRG